MQTPGGYIFSRTESSENPHAHLSRTDDENDGCASPPSLFLSDSFFFSQAQRGKYLQLFSAEILVRGFDIGFADSP